MMQGGKKHEKNLLANICSTKKGEDWSLVVPVVNGATQDDVGMSIYMDSPDTSFLASYRFYDCPFRCPGPERFCDDSGACVCSNNRVGSSCAIPKKRRVGDDPFNVEEQFTPEDEDRFGHSAVLDASTSLIWLFGGYSKTYGPANDVRAFDTRTESWLPVSIRLAAGENKHNIPRPRYFHAAAFHKGSIYVLGGLGGDGEYFADFWRFDVDASSWTQLEDIPGISGLAGHTLTLNPASNTLVVIGGFDKEGKFSDTLYEYDLSSGAWNRLRSPRSLAVYGHTTLYRPESKMFYVFGGVERREGRRGRQTAETSSTVSSGSSMRVSAFRTTPFSDSLRTLHYPTLKWRKLPPARGAASVKIGRRKRREEEEGDKVEELHGRFLHAAASLSNYMVILGGGRGDNEVLLYVYQCGIWISLADISGGFRRKGAALTAAEDLLYFSGGATSSHEAAAASLLKIHLPDDYCGLFRSTSHSCIGIPGCSHCSIYGDSGNNTFCYSNVLGRRPEACYSFETGILEFNDGSSCRCENVKDYGSCLALPHCRMCLNEDSCPYASQCVTKDFERDKALDDYGCWAIADCEACSNSRMNCVWARPLLPSHAEGQRFVYNWNCMKKSTVDRLSETGLLVAPLTCPTPCSSRTGCEACLAQPEDGLDCVWSEQSKSCIAASAAPLQCFGGADCGRLHVDQCPPPCSSFSNCKSCLGEGGLACGWCAEDTVTGKGMCSEGRTTAPLHETCESGDKANMIQGSEKESSPSSSWNFLQCPPENECLNGNHDCDEHSEDCIDTKDSYECVCKEG